MISVEEEAGDTRCQGRKKTGRLHQQTPCSRIDRDGIVRDNGACRD